MYLAQAETHYEFFKCPYDTILGILNLILKQQTKAVFKCVSFVDII